MLTSAPIHAWAPTLTSSTSVRPMMSSGTSTSNDKPPVHSASTNGEMMDGGAAATATGAGLERVVCAGIVPETGVEPCSAEGSVSTGGLVTVPIKPQDGG